MITVDSDPFDYLGDTDYISKKSESYTFLVGLTADWRGLMALISAAALLITGVAIFILCMLTKKSDKRTDLKSLFSWKLVVLIIFECMGLIAGIALSIAKALVG